MTTQEELTINMRVRDIKEQHREQNELALQYAKQGNQMALNCRQIAIAYLESELSFLINLLKPELIKS